MYILAIDPGSGHSGTALYDIKDHRVVWADDIDNNVLLQMIRQWDEGPHAQTNTVMAIEKMENQGQFVGATTFDTAEWMGMFREAWHRNNHQSFKISRRDVKTVMCGGNTYRDPNTGGRKTVNDTIVSRAVRNRFPATGGGKRPEVGTKSQPGPLYGVKGPHQYSAIAIALTCVEAHKDEM